MERPNEMPAVARGPRTDDQDELGMTTAELLGNAALGIAALVAIWALLQALGMDIVNWIRSQLGV